jgi:hypothetical protein
MTDVFSKINIEITKDNKKDIDRKIHDYLKVEYKNCSTTWKLIKERRASNPETFLIELKNVLNS